jgi:outer membrane lipoprotein-sorting protein
MILRSGEKVQMKFRMGCVVLGLAVSPLVLCASSTKSAKTEAAQSAVASAPATLESTLASMDKASTGFKTIQATFAWDQYTKVVDETDTQTGTIYFRRLSSDSVEMAAHIDKPEMKVVLYSRGEVRVYDVKNHTEQKYDAAKNKEEFNSFLMLGFGGRGHDLTNKFGVEFGGDETVQGTNTAKLLLTPKDEQVLKMFSQIILWIDTSRGISVQQKFIQPKSGDYRLAKYSDIRINQKLPDDTFKIKAH